MTSNAVRSLLNPMKNLIKINPTSFILGAVLGGLTIFTTAAESPNPTVWSYKVEYDALIFDSPGHYSQFLNKVATNGWEIVSTQFVPPTGVKDTSGAPFGDESKAHVYVVLRHPKN